MRGPLSHFALVLMLVVSAGVHAPGLAGGNPANPFPEDAVPGVEPAKVEAAPATAKPAAPTVVPPTSAAESMCLLIELAARANDLPVEFFARVIWQESRFNAEAIGPMTRRGSRALGIAQFMPGTAAERQLLDPFDPVQALPKSAEFLKELRADFGNLGLAAAAYNAGPRRVREWLSGTGYMPQETRSYVAAITGATVDDWAAARDQPRPPDPPRTVPGCRELIALIKRAPNPFVEELEQRITLAELKPWGVQLAAGFSKNCALASYARATRRLGAILSDRDPSILATRLRSRGTNFFYQVRVGADTRAGADDLCNQIRRAGGACLVLRNVGRGRG